MGIFILAELNKLYSLERQGLIQRKLVSNVMVIQSAKKVQKIMNTITGLNLKIQECLKSLSIG